MTDDPSPNATPLDEELVAYLDGELDPEGSRRIEELLASNAEVRRRLQEMERTWQLLDDLDTAPVGDQFARSTLEMVAVAAHKDVEQSMAEAPRRRRRRFLAVVVGLLAAVLAGFFAVALLWPNADRQLLEDLPVLENLDLYRQIDAVEFLDLLRSLDKTGLLPKDAGEGPNSATRPSAESLTQRRQRVESMSPGEKEQLARLQERFAALEADQQQRLRRLDDAVQRNADAPQLRQVMRHYGEWLKTLPSYTRAELAELTPADRIKSVKKRLEAERHRGGRRLDAKDLTALLKWTNAYVSQHEAQFVKTLNDQQRKRLDDRPPQFRHQWIRWLMLRQAASGDKPPALLTDEDLARLRAELSPEVRRFLETLPSPKQWQQVADWMPHPARQRLASGSFSKVRDEALANFFEHELTDKERNDLLSLPGEEMQRRLQQLYHLARTAPRDGPGRRPEGLQRAPRHDDDRPPSHRRDDKPESEKRPAPAEKR
jgi:hypothetical protein